MFKTIKQFILHLCMTASVASAQDSPPANVFFGFDFVLQPIAIKWACGGPRDHDLAAFEALMAAFPEDARRANLQSTIDDMLHVSVGEAGVNEVIGAEVTSKQAEQLCNVARPLSIVWATPEQLINHDEDAIPPEQKSAWAKFWETIESIQ